MMNTTILTDMDGTLTKGSIVLEHAKHLIDKGLIEDDGSYNEWIKDVKNERLIVAVAENYRYQLIGKKVKDLDIENFIASQLADNDKWYSVTSEIMDKASIGARVIIISGSSHFLVSEIAKQLGVEGIGSDYKTCENGLLTGEVKGMFGEAAKDEFIQGLDLQGQRLIGYGDTGADNGIFKHCDENILVDPTSDTIEYLLLNQTKIDRIVKA